MEAEIPRVALLDDGELDDVRAALRALGVAHCDARRATIGEAVPILFSTPSHARALAAGRGEAPPHHLHAVIGSGGEASGAPCDLELVRPIESSVLRLLTRRPDLAASQERRLSTRVALGTPVWVSIGGDRREVTISRISIGGCGLVEPGAPAHGRARGDRAAARAQRAAPPRALGRSARLARAVDRRRVHVRRLGGVPRARSRRPRHAARADGAPRDRLPPAHRGQLRARRPRPARTRAAADARPPARAAAAIPAARDGRAATASRTCCSRATSRAAECGSSGTNASRWAMR